MAIAITDHILRKHHPRNRAGERVRLTYFMSWPRDLALGALYGTIVIPVGGSPDPNRASCALIRLDLPLPSKAIQLSSAVLENDDPQLLFVHEMFLEVELDDDPRAGDPNDPT
jgi:hypothetical protein